MSTALKEHSLFNGKVYPILIATPFAVGDVFSYLIKDDKTVLVDCGHKSEAAYETIKMALAEEGLSIDDLDEIWLTHGHPDHFGQAATLAEKSGAVIKGHPQGRANFAGNSDRSLFKSFFEDFQIPVAQIDEMLNQLEWLQQFQDPVEPAQITEGDELSSGQFSFRVKHTPGHAPGHVVFYSDGGILFGGDVLLEHISTNALINFDPDSGTRNKSLLQYRQSLQWMKQQKGRVLPGHGKQINDIKKVANHHLEEQNERFAKIKERLSRKSATLMTLAQTIFPEALKEGAHFLVFSEVMGYLDWGMEEGTIRKVKEGNGIIFEWNDDV